MKGGIYVNGLRGKRFSIILISLICVTILLWAWEKTPLVTVFPSQNQLDFLPPVIIKSAPVNSSTYVNNTVSVDEAISYKTDEKEKIVDEAISFKTDEKDKSVEQNKSSVEENVSTSQIETRNDQERKEIKVAPVVSVVNGSPKEEIVDGGLKNPHVKKKECNYAKGKWVADGGWPLYSGFNCKQWLSEMWACRLTQRPNFSYEGFRWQPENCEMPVFDGSTFFKRMQDKTVAFVGDSLGRQQFQSLMCMVTGGKYSPDVQNVGWKYGLVKRKGAIRPDGWAYWFPKANTTILYYWSASLCDLEPLNVSDPVTNYAMHLDRPVAFLQRYLSRFDVLILNTGHHWNRGKIQVNRWVMYVNGKPLRDRRLLQIGNAKNFTIYSVANWLDKQLQQRPQLKAFFCTLSPRHFANGDWNTGGSCNNLTPLTHGDSVSQDESFDPLIAGAVKGTRIGLLDISGLSQLRDEGHISHYSIRATEGVNDCLHWCLPGIPDTWNEILFAQV